MYTLPTDTYQVDVVNLLRNDGEYEEYSCNKYEESDKTIVLLYEEVGEFRVVYYAYPESIPFDADDVNISDDVELDILDEYIPALINSVSGKLKANVDKKYAVGDRYSAIGIDNINAALSERQKKSVETKIRRRC